jgi:hypothetical protein
MWQEKGSGKKKKRSKQNDESKPEKKRLKKRAGDQERSSRSRPTRQSRAASEAPVPLQEMPDGEQVEGLDEDGPPLETGLVHTCRHYSDY